jgi:hypothetical protein
MPGNPRERAILGMATSLVRSIERISAALERLQEAPNVAAVRISSAERKSYIEFKTRDGHTWAEAVSNEVQRDPIFRLSVPQVRWMFAMGWRAPNKQIKNFHRVFNLEGETSRLEASRIAVDTLVNVYGVRPTERLTIDTVAHRSRKVSNRS